MARTCLQCGHVATDDDRFCSVCGTPLELTDEAVVAHTSTGLIAVLGQGELVALDALGDSGEIASLDPGTVAALTAGDAVLLVRRGPLEGQRFVLAGPEGSEVTVGRSPESELFLDDVTVSRKHAQFLRGSSAWSVSDVGSLNGTYVNRERIDDVVLASGDEVQIGKYRFTYLCASHVTDDEDDAGANS